MLSAQGPPPKQEGVADGQRYGEQHDDYEPVLTQPLLARHRLSVASDHELGSTAGPGKKAVEALASQFFSGRRLDEHREKMQSFQANSGLYAVRS